jgi:uncharacterized membrane protein
LESTVSIATIASVIQLAVAPFFLLVGIAGILNVMSSRLGRIVDRVRVVERQIPYAASDEQHNLLQSETASLWRRSRLINWSIRMCITGAILVCFVVMTLFIGAFVELNFFGLIGALFVLAMLFIVAGLVLLLLEVTLSTKHLRQGLEMAINDQKT